MLGDSGRIVADLNTQSSDGEWIKPTFALGQNQEIVGIYGYADEGNEISSVGFLISAFM